METWHVHFKEIFTLERKVYEACLHLRSTKTILNIISGRDRHDKNGSDITITFKINIKGFN